MPVMGSRTPPAGAVPAEAALGAAGVGIPGLGRTLAPAAAITFWVRPRINSSFFPGSGLRTKSTAPADRASNTRRSREDTRITGRGTTGSSCFKKSMPFIPGISTSRVITSGFTCSTLARASLALKLVATTSM